MPSCYSQNFTEFFFNRRTASIEIWDRDPAIPWGINSIDEKCRTWQEDRRRLDQERVGTAAKKHEHRTATPLKRSLSIGVRLYPLMYFRVYIGFSERIGKLLLTDDSVRCIMRRIACWRMVIACCEFNKRTVENATPCWCFHATHRGSTVNLWTLTRFFFTETRDSVLLFCGRIALKRGLHIWFGMV